MATKIYDSKIIHFIDGDVQYITPLKLKYLRPFMEIFTKTDEELDKIEMLLECGTIAMMQYRPEINSKEKLEDLVDIKTLQDIVNIAAGISYKSGEDAEKEKKNDEVDSPDNFWDTLDLAKLESEVFLLGIWKDYEDLESSLSLPELTEILNAKRESDYEDKKFMAAIQGIDLDEKSGNSQKEKDPWQAMKDRVFGASSVDENDITSFKGRKAADAGFGIGMGIGYTDLRQS
jgi:hypothetical protein